MIPLANHLWQSTVFAGVVWVLTLILRRNAAQVRYGLWLAASVKFLVPFSLLVGLGGLMEWRTKPVIVMPSSPAIEQIAEPFTIVSMAAAPDAPSVIPTVIASVWLGGFLLALAVWWAGWRRIRGALREAKPLAMAGHVRVMSAPGLLEPGVFGVFQSTLVVPEGIEKRLTPEQFRAVLAHELCHVRRRDNLAGAIHMIVETLFWFHPVVMWIGRRLLEERELACDEEVLRMGNRPEAYAEGILHVCKSYLESALTCTSGISGGNLKRRIEAILANGGCRRMSTAGKLLLVGVGAAALAGPLLIGMAQETFTFEVASVKPSDPNARGIHMEFTPGGGVKIVNGSLMQLLTMAYEVEKFQISGGPGWIDSARFDIVAKAPAEDTPAAEQSRRARLRLQALLTERFKLAVRRDKKEAAVFALVVAKNGHKLKESDEGPDGLNGRPGQVAGERASMALLARYLGGQLGHPVLDRTGLTKTYKFKLDWFPEMNGPIDTEKAAAAGLSPADPSRPSIFAAIQEQLGLKLDTQKGPVDAIVIDRAEKPSAN